MNLILLTENDRVTESRFKLTDHRSEHIIGTLKSKVDDTLEIGLVDGPQGMARVIAVDQGAVELETTSLRLASPPKPSIDMICALPRPQTLKKVLFIGGMMGVRRLHLIRANRVERSYFQSPLVETINQLPYLYEGMSQGKLTRLPVVEIHDRFRRFFEDYLDNPHQAGADRTLRLLATTESERKLSEVFSTRFDSLMIAVGPEGGWVPFEEELMCGLGFESFTLGRFVLRVEHAALAALAQLELLR